MKDMTEIHHRYVKICHDMKDLPTLNQFIRTNLLPPTKKKKPNLDTLLMEHIHVDRRQTQKKFTPTTLPLPK